MGLFKDINDNISEFLCERSRNSKRSQKEKTEKIRIENARKEKQAKIQRSKVEKLEKEKRKKYWHNVKDDIYSRYQLLIADDAKSIAKDLFGKDLDSLSVFFITDERVVMKIYINGGDRAIEEYAKHLSKHAFIGGPITATLLRRLKLLEDEMDWKVLDTEIDIDGFVPHSSIKYAIDEVDLDGQIIPARRKFSIRCEMTATITEGFRIGPFVPYEELYMSHKEEMEQITDEDIDTSILSDKEKTAKAAMQSEKNKEKTDASEGKKYGKLHKIKVCPHGTDRTLYCSKCHGDIIVSPSKKKIIGICMDTSGSMHGEMLTKAKMAITRVLDNIPVNSNIDVVLIIFDSDKVMSHEDIIPFGTRYTESVYHMAKKRINEVRPGGSTPLYDTINYFIDEIWCGEYRPGEGHFLLDENRIFFPYTYLIIVSDGEENGSELKNIIYEGKMGREAFFAKMTAYRDAGLITEIIPFAYGDGETNNRLTRELRNISGKKLINETCPDNIIESLIGNVDSILYGADNLKMMGRPISRKGDD